MVKINGYIKESISEGSGLKSVLFFSGCSHFCKNCHNPENWDYDAGFDFTEKVQDNVIRDVKENNLLNGITLCGGEPFADRNVKDIYEFVVKIREEIKGINIWAYSGYTFEQLIEDECKRKLLELCDVLVDGKFVDELKDLTAPFKGSKNQRLVCVQESLRQNKVVLYEV